VPGPQPLSLSLLALAAVCLASPVAFGGRVDRAPRTVPSVFFVAKSENRNQVHYGIRLDEECGPSGDSPVFAYWRMFERGPFATEPLLSREVPAYGLAGQQTLQRTEEGSRIVVALRAMPRRPIVIDTAAIGSGCTAKATAPIHGISAVLASVFVQLRWPFGVTYLMLSGRAPDGREVRERLVD